MRNLCYNASKILQLDHATTYSLLFYFANFSARFITIALTVKYLTGDELGFLYTFTSISAAQVFLEMGIGQVVQQLASHQACGFDLKHQSLCGHEKNTSRIRSIFQKSTIAYRAIAFLVIFLIFPIGGTFFIINSHDDLSWIYGWMLTCMNSFLVALTTPKLIILNSCGLITDVIKMTGTQAIFATIIGWALLYLNFGLLSLPFAALIATILRIMRMQYKFARLFALLAEPYAIEDGISWKSDIWPLHWRIAISWMSGYFISQLFVPVTFSFHGPTIAGRLGLGITIANAIQGVGSTWITTKLPTICASISKNKFSEVDRLFRNSLVVSWLTVGVLCSFVLFVCVLGVMLDLRFAERLPHPITFSILALIALTQHYVSSIASYLRAYNEEPFLGISVVSGILVATICLPLSKIFGTDVMLFAHLMITLVIGGYWGTRLFIDKRIVYQMRYCDLR